MLHIQDSSYSASYSLHEALLAAAEEATSGGGAYAFVSISGVKLFLEDGAFRGLLERGDFQLIVGIDQITNPPTLEKLQEIDDVYPNFSVSAYWQSRNSLIFHPKFSWFRKEDGGVLVVGSGNMTVNGLRKNTEAFVVHELDEQQIDDVEATWASWLDEVGDVIHPVADADVLERARQNQSFAHTLRARGTDPESGASLHEEDAEDEPNYDIEVDDDLIEPDVDINAWRFQDSSRVLVAEIPRSGNRWNQANFDVGSFTDFFGAKAGDNSQRILLRNIADDGSLGEIETRPSVSVISKNYRFELYAATGIDYPGEGRPTGIFLEISRRVFLYVLLLPGSPSHREAERWLLDEWAGRADRMRRIISDVRTIRANCPSLACWTI